LEESARAFRNLAHGSVPLLEVRKFRSTHASSYCFRSDGVLCSCDAMAWFDDVGHDLPFALILTAASLLAKYRDDQICRQICAAGGTDALVQVCDASR
jgi:hypothetical protein